MRPFFRSHWKVILAILLLIVLAMVTVNPSAAVPAMSLGARLQMHACILAAPRDARQAADYVEGVLAGEGYRVRRQPGGGVEAALENGVPARSFIVNARYDSAAPDGYGAAAVLELARLLKTLQPRRGTEVRFVFSAQGGSGNFIAYAGSAGSMRAVQTVLSAFQDGAAVPARGLAAPAYVRGITLSAHDASMPAVMVTESGFARYPYYRAGAGAGDDAPEDGVARVVTALARTITALAAGARM
jgi:hypothetical protein